ncbi:MAG: endolytic transglycosylase MltG [Vicinamibacterales bacterium]
MLKTLALFVLLLLLAAGAGSYVLYARIDAPYKSYEGESQEVEIPSGVGTRAIGRLLVDAGVLPDDLTYRAALWLSGDARRLKAGQYRFDRPMSPRDVLGKIARGEVDLVNITFREGLTIGEMATLFEAQGLGSASAFTSAASDASLIADLDPTATDLEGYLFPETYAVSRHVEATQLVRAMVDRFTKVLTADMREAATARQLTLRQLVTLASIVEKETGAASERPTVAAVYANRLRIGMGLQCDPTVIYALQRAGKFDGNLRRDDLAFDSPYNTYRYPGLPPGPIAAPGRGALEAAAHPAEVDYLYFVSRNDGTHAFAKSLDEHNRNVQKFQVQYFREKRIAERRREQAAQVGR